MQSFVSNFPYKNEIINKIEITFQPERIYLFGSYARGEFNESSDLDILVEFADFKDKRKLAVEIRKALSDIPLPKDILIIKSSEIESYKEKNWSVYSNALKEGKLLYERKIS
ncbi:MAG: nucleotidyltransferase domain-containing protein [Leptospiraceae bacterium]|nr:nucleotidyltransferase domain-containing protein [Leptospiraceae bacterium]MCZ8348278.1 nucleotidyltransferase domain-containing protein [Leptospiraceae bacterium]